MSLNLERNRHFPVSPDVLLNILTRRDFYVARFAMSGISDFGCDVEKGKDGTCRVTLTRALDASKGGNKVPGFARRFMGSAVVLTTEFDWQPGDAPPYLAHFRLSLAGVPVTVSGTMQLVDDGQGTVQQMQADIRSSVPLIGNKLCQLVADQVDRGLERDSRATLRYLEQVGHLADGAD